MTVSGPVESSTSRNTVGSHFYLVISSAGPNRDLTRDTRAQALWDEHAAFIDALVEAGVIVMGGPLIDEGGAMTIFNASNETEVRRWLARDRWYAQGILTLESVRRWEIYIDHLHN